MLGKHANIFNNNSHLCHLWSKVNSSSWEAEVREVSNSQWVIEVIGYGGNFHRNRKMWKVVPTREHLFACLLSSTVADTATIMYGKLGKLHRGRYFWEGHLASALSFTLKLLRKIKSIKTRKTTNLSQPLLSPPECW